MKKVLSIVLGVVGFVVALSAVSTAESDFMYPFINLMFQTFAGFMLIGMSFAIARWK